ncbi:hypothetical protein [Plantactinospora sonchi]|uniref:Uncharacterized protein n=1 Tax=Plantactinospora sonchi TaxID=1544735 RepID=A0ABU7RM96_9ACTN
MTEHHESDQHQRAPLGQAPDASEPESEPDFAAEHDKTAVQTEIITNDDNDREPESPRGWAGMQR